MTNTFLRFPRIDLSQLEARAVTQFEQHYRRRVDLETENRYFIESICVNYLRHNWMYEYDAILNRRYMTSKSYLKLYKEFVDAVEAHYPTLGCVAQIQYQKRRRILEHPATHSLDNRLDEILSESPEGTFGFGFGGWSIRAWRWKGQPGDTPLHERIVCEIDKAHPKLCAASESPYVRYCKQWLLRRAETTHIRNAVLLG